MKLSAHDRETIIKALRVGLVPRTGLQHIQVGRAAELGALAKDTNHLAQGGATVRLLIGPYGSGKTFLLNLARLMAIETGIIVLSAQMSPDRRLHASQGQARLLYAELARNAAGRTRRQGGAIKAILERFTHEMINEAQTTGQPLKDTTDRHLSELADMPGGYDFLTVIEAYQRGYEADDQTTRDSAVRWLQGEYTTKVEARKHLGVRTIIDDRNIYDSLRLLAAFVRGAGHPGMLVCLDELSSIARLNSAQARRSNYDQLVYLLNDIYQGSARWIGFVLAGTPDGLEDSRRGLYSHEALASRLQENAYATEKLVDMEHPIIRVRNLEPEDLYVLLTKVRDLMQKKGRVDDNAIRSFMTHCYERIGAAYFQTPRTTVTAWVNLLSLLEQHPSTEWTELLSTMKVERDVDPTAGGWEESTEEPLSNFEL